MFIAESQIPIFLEREKEKSISMANNHKTPKFLTHQTIVNIEKRENEIAFNDKINWTPSKTNTISN